MLDKKARSCASCPVGGLPRRRVCMVGGVGFFQRFLFLGVFPVLSSLCLRSWGSPSGAVCLAFVFRWGSRRSAWGGLARVVVWCASRSAAARVLWSLRAARRAVLSTYYVRDGDPLLLLVPPARVVASDFPRFGLRWLACRWCRLAVVVRGGRCRWFVVPPGGVVRPSRVRLSF